MSARARLTRHPYAVTVSALVASLGLAACSGGSYPETPLPTSSASASPSSSATTPAPAPAACDRATSSYDALERIPSAASIDDRAMRAIIERGYLRVGVSADSFLLGANNPLTGEIEGFDIDIAKAIAQSLFGDADAIRPVVLTAADRIPALQDGRVDLVARNMTMTCVRWEDIAFSSEYYHAGQKVLVNLESSARTLEDLRGQRVCAPTGTTSLAKLREVSGVEVVTAANHTGCLVLFQQGRADAITGDDTVLAGLAAQDPYAKVTDAEAITDEPYGLGIAKDNVYFVRYVNAVLERLRADGGWAKIYNRWLAESLGPAPEPPAPVYGRR